MANTHTQTIDEKLFPPPSSSLQYSNGKTTYPAPLLWPGVSSASSTTVQEILTDNHRRFHVFFNDRGFHNHVTHTILTLWALGADETVLREAYAKDGAYQRPGFKSPNVITKENWKEFLGKEEYYQAYLEFFKGELESSSSSSKPTAFSEVLERYVFSDDANTVPGTEEGVKPEMLNRFFAGLFHPMIQLAFGLEFGLPGTVAEGLAQTAVHTPETPKLLPLSWWGPSTSQVESGLASQFASAVVLGPGGQKESEKKSGEGNDGDVHAFTVLARILADPNLAPKKPSSPFGFFGETHEKLGDGIRAYVDQWTVPEEGEEGLRDKADELIWTMSLIYAVCGSGKQGATFNADFFYVHFVTSSIFLHIVLSNLTNDKSKALFLRGYYSVALGWYVARGRPALDIVSFFSSANDNLRLTIPNGAQPTPHENARPSKGPSAITPNAWLAILQSTLTHPDEHLSKTQRALAEFAVRFGRVRAGGGGGGGKTAGFGETELDGAGVVDGTLFLRAAALTANRLGWAREGEKPLEGPWDRYGFI